MSVYAYSRHLFELDSAALAWQAEPSTVFAAWAAHNSRSYAPEEFQTRLPVFKANVARQLERLGLREGTAEVNGLADISREEFKATHLGHVSRSTVAELGCAPARAWHAK